jgi:hypothetical protein
MRAGARESNFAAHSSSIDFAAARELRHLDFEDT